MDYKYINQLLERYWECQTTLEEEKILRAFFSQEDIPASLLLYRDLFVYQATETKSEVLGEDFDAKILQLIGDEKPVKAKVISFRQRLIPLFKAAAVVAIFLTLGNAMQASFNNNIEVAESEHVNTHGVNVAQSDSVKVDSIHRTSIGAGEVQGTNPFNQELFQSTISNNQAN